MRCLSEPFTVIAGWNGGGGGGRVWLGEGGGGGGRGGVGGGGGGGGGGGSARKLLECTRSCADNNGSRGMFDSLKKLTLP